MLNVRVFSELPAITGLAPIWNELLSRSRSRSPFLTWEWISTWLEVYGEHFEPMVLTAEDDGEPCGIAPLMIRRGSGPVARLSRTLMFIGQDVDVTPDNLDFIIPEGLEAWVMAAFVRELTHGMGGCWDFIDLTAHPRGSPNLLPLLRRFGETGIQLRAVAEDVAPYVELPDSFAAFLQRKSSGFRRQHQNKRNRLKRAGQVRYLLGGQDLPTEVALQHLIRLNRDRWQDSGASFRTEAYRRFHHLLCQQLAPLGQVALMLMELDGEVVAGRYDFVCDGKLWCYQGGWSHAHHELNLGDNMLAAVIEWAIGQGLREYDFLGGAAAYKHRWATACRHMQELRAVNRTGRAQLLGVLRRSRDRLGPDLPSRAVRTVRAFSRRWWGEPWRGQRRKFA